MDSHQAATSGLEALNIRSEREEPTTHANRSRDDATLHNVGSRKRQKVGTLSTTPFANPQISDEIQTASHTLVGVPADPSGTGEFDYLLHWQHADHGIADDDDSSVDGDDEDEDGSEEMEEEEVDGGHQEDIAMLPKAPGKGKLTADQIVEIINDSISYYAGIWKPNKDVIKGDEVDYDPEKMWLTAEEAGTRQELIKRYEADVAYFTQRLDKLCDEIVKASDNNEKDVKKRCRHLEVTVNSVELAEWLLSIYRLDASDEEDIMDNSNMPVLKEGPSALPVPRRQMTDIIDLGSPPESSDGDDEGMIVDSSPQPQISIGQGLYAADFVIGGSVVPESVVSESAIPRSANTDSIIGDSAIVDTVEPRIPPDSHISSGGTFGLRARYTQQATTIPTPEVSHVLRHNSRIRHGNMPQEASIMTSDRWSWDHLQSAQDRKRIVTKVVRDMPAADRDIVRQRLATVEKADILREIPVCVQMLANSETRMHGVLPRDLAKIKVFARLFLSWWLCDNYFRAEPSEWDLNELQKCLEEQSPDPSAFYDYVLKIMNTTFSAEALEHPTRPSQAEVIDLISDDDESPTQSRQPQRRSQPRQRRPSQSFTPIVLD